MYLGKLIHEPQKKYLWIKVEEAKHVQIQSDGGDGVP
jgi:hypothetical protein